MAEIGVIVPVFKAEAYLAACIDSILNQSVSDFELVLVDDGSPDRCGAICEDYARRDSRIKVLHQQNQGQAAARNHALAVTNAPWICFVDSDDLIHPQTLELLSGAARDSGAPMSMAGMLEAPELPADFLTPRDGTYRVLDISDDALVRMYDEGTYPAWVACAKLIRRELIEAHPFCSGRVFEDNEAVCHWVTAAGKIAQVPQNLYFYRTNPDSTTQKSFSLKKLDFLWAMEQIIHFYGTVGYEQIRRRFFERYVRETGTCWRMVRYSLGQPGEAGKLKKNLKTLLKEEKLSLNREQKEYLLDAMHPVLIRLYWPAAGLADTLRQEGVAGIACKIKKHLGGRQS